jgi:hypothetical protein
MVEAERELRTSSLVDGRGESSTPRKSLQTILMQQGKQLARSRDDLFIQSQLVTKVLLIIATIAPRAGAANDLGRENALDVEIKSPQSPGLTNLPITRRSSIPED